MRVFWLALALGAAPLSAETVWTLRSGPDAVHSIPLDPAQPVPAWKGVYGDGDELVVVYATRSPNFFAPRIPEVVAVAGTPWTAALFFPASWKAEDRLTWLRSWVAGFQELATLPEPGFPIVFPAVLRKN